MKATLPTEQDRYKNKLLTIPNLLSLLRLAMIPLLVWLYVGQYEYRWTAVVLLLSGLTDIVDGQIARHFSMVSDFGKFLDPIADKLTQLAMLACMVTRFPMMKVPLLLLVFKEVVSGLMGVYAAQKTGVVFSAEWHGKATTCLIYLTIMLHLLWINIPIYVTGGLTILCTFMMLLSGILYLIRSIRLFQSGQKALSRRNINRAAKGGTR